MMNDLSRLQKLLNPNVLVTIQENSIAKLSEKNEQRDYSINLEGIPANTLIIKADVFYVGKFLDCSGVDGICKRADYIVVNESEIIFIEMKFTSILKQEDIQQQLTGAQCVMDYLIALGKRFFDHPHFLDMAVKKPHFVLVQYPRFDKRSTRVRGYSQPKQSATNNSPEKMLHLKLNDAGLLRYKQLLS